MRQGRPFLDHQETSTHILRRVFARGAFSRARTTSHKIPKKRVARRRHFCILTPCASTFPGGAVVAQLTVNQRVVGSNPTRGARIFRGRRVCPFGLFSVLGGCPRNCFPCTGDVWEFGRLSDDDLEIVVLVLGTSRNAAPCPAVRLPSVTTSPVHRVQRDKSMVF